MYSIILADEIGDKLWPVTCPEFPKAFLPVYSENTLLEETIMRIMPFVEKGENVFITVPEKGVASLVKQASLTAFSIPEENLIHIPESKGSLWSILAACKRIKTNNKKDLVMISPVDQFFWPRESIIVHINNLIAGAVANPGNLVMLCLPPGGPSPLLNYVSGEWQGVKTVGIPLEDALSGLLNTLMVDIQGYMHKPDFEQAQTMVNGNWLWDLSTYVTSAQTIEKNIRALGDDYKAFAGKRDLMKVWKELPHTVFEDSVVPRFIEQGKAKGAIIPKILWSTLDNWVSIQHLLYDAGLFNSRPIAGVHLVEAKNNLVFKPPNKDVALFGVSNLIVIDTGDKLLIGTPGGLYENF